MAYYGAFQSSGFQRNAFQILAGAVSAAATGGLPTPYSYFPLWQKRQEAQIKKQKSELQKLDSVLAEFERRKALAEESLRLAEETEHQRLLAAQNALLDEISRLLVVRAEMMALLRRNEEFLFVAIVARKRMRAFNLTPQRI